PEATRSSRSGARDASVAVVSAATTVAINKTRNIVFPMCLLLSRSLQRPPTLKGVEGETDLSGERTAKTYTQPAVRTRTNAPACESLCGEVSMLLRAWSDGDPRALAQLTPIVYDELRRLARRYMRSERAGHSLQTTALVHEAYLRLVDYKRMRWQNRAHFLAVSAQGMRRILVDHARRRNAKRGADQQRVSLEAAAIVSSAHSTDFVALDDALTALAEQAPRKAHVVELRFFGGLSVEETAEVLHVSSITVMREWK